MNTKKVTVFKDLIENDQILTYLKLSKLSRPTNVQKIAINKLSNEGSFIVQGKTGSGKTLAFLIPLFLRLKKLEANGIKANKSRPLSIILTPTRELSLQVFAIAKELSHHCKVRVRKLVGGDKGAQMMSVFNSNMDILIATPERLLRAVKNKEILLNDLSTLVFDEADQLLENSFKTTITDFTARLDLQKTQVLLFSATTPLNFEEITKIAFPNINFNILGKGEENRIGHDVKTKNFNTTEDDKLYMFESFVKNVGKSNGIVFTGNRHRAQKAYDKLVSMGHQKAYLIHKEIEKNQRSIAMSKFKQSGGIIIATDILARGVDITHLNWVLNYDLPSDSEYYLHRTGRVGRAGKKGDVYNFVTLKDSVRQQRINKALLTQGRLDLKLPEIKVPKKKSLNKKSEIESKKETMTKRRMRRR